MCGVMYSVLCQLPLMISMSFSVSLCTELCSADVFRSIMYPSHFQEKHVIIRDQISMGAHCT